MNIPPRLQEEMTKKDAIFGLATSFYLVLIIHESISNDPPPPPAGLCFLVEFCSDAPAAIRTRTAALPEMLR